MRSRIAEQSISEAPCYLAAVALDKRWKFASLSNVLQDVNLRREYHVSRGGYSDGESREKKDESSR